MAGFSNHLRRILAAAMPLAVLGVSGGGLAAGDVDDSETDGPVMIGEMTRQEIEAALPDWVEEQVLSRPDTESASSLADALQGAEVMVLLGTWCSDSRRELARLWRALDEVGALDPDQLRYIGVDREMQEPSEWVTGSDLRLVPTFIVRRREQELGRIVESSPQGIEIDLLALLRGELSGVISASDELELDEDGR